MVIVRLYICAALSSSPPFCALLPRKRVMCRPCVYAASRTVLGPSWVGFSRIWAARERVRGGMSSRFRHPTRWARCTSIGRKGRLPPDAVDGNAGRLWSCYRMRQHRNVKPILAEGNPQSSGRRCPRGVPAMRAADRPTCNFVWSLANHTSGAGSVNCIGLYRSDAPQLRRRFGRMPFAACCASDAGARLHCGLRPLRLHTRHGLRRLPTTMASRAPHGRRPRGQTQRHDMTKGSLCNGNRAARRRWCGSATLHVGPDLVHPEQT